MPQLLMERIKIYNTQYRMGKSQIGDDHYDALLEEVRNELKSETLFKVFLESLCEPGGDIKLRHIAGSLKKVTYGTDQLGKYINKFPKSDQTFLISAKLDGMGYVATFVDGVLVTVSTTGDGETAKDITHTAKFCIPNMIDVEGLFIVRGELVMTKDDAIKLGYKNARNGVVGLMKKDEPDYQKMNFVRAPAYQIMNDYVNTYDKQYALLKKHFEVPYCQVEKVQDYNNSLEFEEEIKTIMEGWKTRPYLIDGIVISQINSKPENVKLPTNTVAFKVNNDTFQTTVVGMDIVTSKDGVLNGVAQLAPIEINGTTVSRAAIYNYDNVVEKQIGPGAEVVIVKAGEIIPKIITVLKPADIHFENHWKFCSECGTETIHEGVHMICPNPDCTAKKIGSVSHFIGKCGIKGASETSFRNWEIYSIEDLLKFIPEGKAAEKFYKNFEEVVFRMPEIELIGKFNWTGAGEKTVQKYINELGIDEFLDKANIGGSVVHPAGCGELTWTKIVDKFQINYHDYKLIITDKRYKKPVFEDMIETVQTVQTLNSESFCCTGKVSRPRKEIEADIIRAGGVIKSVSKNLDYLVAGEKAGSKLEKAEKLGITVITESELMEMLNV